MDNMNYMMQLAKRNSLTSKASHLSEDIVKESTEIIKFRVAQSFAFCELQKNYEQLDNNHERLHHNMLEVQMEHEDISAQFQEELRLRPQTLNKVLHTRTLCESLEQCCSRLKETLVRCQADQSMLYRVYETSEKKLLHLTQNQQQQQQHYQLELATLNDQVKLLKEEKCKTENELSDVKQQANDTKSSLLLKEEMMLHLKEQMSQVIDKMSNTIDKQHQQIVQKDEMVNSMKDDIKQLVYECEAQNTKMTNDITRLELELKSCTAAKGALEVSLKESIDHSKSLMDTIKEQEKVRASLLAEKSELRKQNRNLNDTLVECQTKLDEKQEEILNLNEQFKNITLNNDELNKQLQKLESTVKELTKNNEELQVNNETLSKLLSQYKEDVTLKTATINHLNSVNAELTNKISQLQDDGKISEQKTAELTNMLDAKQEQLNQATVNINTLMNKVKNITEAKSRSEAVLDNKTKTYEEVIVQYKDNLKDKDKKLEEDFRLILELRAEKSRLQQKVSSLEKTIGNVHRQVANRVPSSTKVTQEAERDRPPVATQQHARGSNDTRNRDLTKCAPQKQLSCESTTSYTDSLPVLQIFSNIRCDEDDSKSLKRQPSKRRRQQAVVAQTQPPTDTYNPYSTTNMEETEKTSFNDREEKPRQFFKTKRNQARGKKF